MTEFGKHYIAARKKEGFYFTDAEVAKLPVVNKDNQHADKWRVRLKSADRILKYLKSNCENNVEVLDLGCGNGWFAAKLASNVPGNIYGWDVNEVELKQAERIFNYDNLSFHYQDVFDVGIKNSFDFIILNSVVQYFPDPDKLMNRLMALLNKNGEIHILDSPFYKQNKVDRARDRTIDYYQQLGMPEMAEFYHHHSLESLGNVSLEMMYDPQGWRKRLSRKLGFSDSPFLWLKIKKD